MSTIFQPAIKLSNLLSFKGKFVLLTVVCAIPLIIFFSALASSQWKLMSDSEDKLQVSAYIMPLRNLLEHVAQTRGMTNAYLNGNPSFLQKILDKRIEVDKDFQDLLSVSKSLGSKFISISVVEAAHEKWKRLKSAALSSKSTAVFKSYTGLVENVIDIMDTISRRGGLDRDSDSINGYLTNTLVHTIPNQVEDLGRLRGKGAGVIASKDFSIKNKLEVSALAETKNTLKLKKDFEYLFSESPSIKQKLDASQDSSQKQLKQYLKLAHDEIIDADSTKVTTEEFFNNGSEVISSLLFLFDSSLPILIERLELRMERAKYNVMKYQVLLVFVFITLIYLYMSIYLGLKQSIEEVRKAAAGICDGRLDTRLSLYTNDELKYVAQSFNDIASGVSRSIITVKKSSENISKVAQEIALESDGAANGMKRQSEELAQTSTAITQMSTSVNEVAKNTEQASMSASDVNNEAKKGAEIVGKTVEAINTLAENITIAVNGVHDLEESSNNITKILDVIRGIAEQTNLLALNAAIEAARAGEQGRGFAVVADEVRTLAQRTQDSTHEIQTMIEVIQSGISGVASAMVKSKGQADVAVELSGNAGEALSVIESSVHGITKMSIQIAAAAEQQSCVSDEISKSIVTISDVAMDATRGSQKLAQAGSRLAAMSDEMTLTVKRYHIDGDSFEKEEESNNLLCWKHEYDLGVFEADRQHQKMIDMMNDVHILASQGRSGDSIAQSLDSLISYARVHFDWEENLFDSYQYPGAEDHKIAHKKLIEELRSHQKNIEVGSIQEIDREMEMLNDWLMKHIQYSDRDYANYLNNNDKYNAESTQVA